MLLGSATENHTGDFSNCFEREQPVSSDFAADPVEDLHVPPPTHGPHKLLGLNSAVTCALKDKGKGIASISVPLETSTRSPHGSVHSSHSTSSQVASAARASQTHLVARVSPPPHTVLHAPKFLTGPNATSSQARSASAPLGLTNPSSNPPGPLPLINHATLRSKTPAPRCTTFADTSSLSLDRHQSLRRSNRHAKPSKVLKGFLVGPNKRKKRTSPLMGKKEIAIALKEAGLSRDLLPKDGAPPELSSDERSALSGYCGIVGPPPIKPRLASAIGDIARSSVVLEGGAEAPGSF